MTIRCLLVGSAFAVAQLMVTADWASAQLNRGGGSSLRSGNSLLRPGALGGSNAGFGSGQIGRPQGVFGQQGRLGQSGFGLGFQQAGLGGGLMGGNQQNTTGIVGGAQDPQGFVGRDAEDRRLIFENMRRNQGRQGNFNTNFESLDEMRDQNRRSQNQNQEPSPALVRLQPDFDLPPAVASRRVAPAVQARLTEIMGTEGRSPPQVAIEGRTATLFGAVATEHQRRLAEKLVSIEPGVSEVINQLTVDSSDDGS